MCDKDTIDFRSTEHLPRKRRRQWAFLAILAGITLAVWALVLTQWGLAARGQTAAMLRLFR
ncbi:hypothetical protein [Mameliella sp.]|uniref:hypothetical protein n=1 Tax=Mameliella sp. TaxID=1924940 RepID=UPI003BAD1398